jgi:hypothetical protein
MDEQVWLAERLEEHRSRLRAVAYRKVGSLTEADEAVQDAWLRISRLGAGEIDNPSGQNSACLNPNYRELPKISLPRTRVNRAPCAI